MNSKLNQEYTARICNANRSELVVIIYELIEQNLENAKNYYSENNEELFKKHMVLAEKLVHELIEALDFKYDISRNLFSLYVYINKLLIESKIKFSDKKISEISKIIDALKSSFIEVAKQDTSGAVMENTQTLYAGLTYGKGNLNETFVCEGIENRGFIA